MKTGAACPRRFFSVHKANPAPQPPAEQKNTARSQAESTTVNTDPAQHTAAEQAVIDEYQAAVDDNLRLIVEEYKTNPNRPFARHSISPVAERQAKDAENLLGGSYSGFTNAINSNGIKHILKEHGENGVVDHSMADVNDLARIAYVLDNYDTVNQATYASGDIKYSQEFRGKNNRPAPMLVFSKKVNGTYYVIEAVPDTQYKKFWVVSAYMEKKGGITQAPNAQGQGNTPEASLASLPPKTNVSEKSIAQNGKNSNGNSQTAVEQEYRTLVGNAIREGDYQHALKLFREYNNPALRAYKEFYTLKTFSEYAVAQGYIPATDTSLGTEETLAAFEESYQNAIENAAKDGIIKSDEQTDAALNSAADPMADVFGAGEDSHPEEIARFRQLLNEYGVELVERETEALAYGPGASPGVPGKIYVSKGASYSAWVHEMGHVEDDRAAGWLGMRVFGDPDLRYAWEVHAYGLEIELALQAGRSDIADKLRENLEQERRMIYGENYY